MGTRFKCSQWCFRRITRTGEEVHRTNKITSPVVCDMGQMTISYFNAKPGQAKIEVPHLFLMDKQGMIRDDWDYTDKNRAVFEGPGLSRKSISF